MSVFSQIMMRKKNIEIYPPTNVVFTKAGEGITCVDYYGSRTYTKDYDGLAYGGIAKWQDNGDWQMAIFVSENREACMNTGNGQYPSTISDTPFNYKGKNWYYVVIGSAINANGYYDNGYYLINENYYSGTQAEQTLQCAKALLDYVYSFTANTFSFCDYIETTGTQYIDTRLTPTSNTRVMTKVKVTTTSQNIPVFGCKNNGAYYHLTPFNSKWYYGLNNSEGNAGSYNNTIGTEYEIDFNNNGNIIINNNIISSGITTTGNSNLLISLRGGLYGKWQYQFFKVYENDILVRNYLPTYNSANQKYGLLDKVTKMFYVNQGTGNFTGA